jgi:hypothetical protein
MTQHTLRLHLLALCNEFLDEGGDPAWLFAELTTCGTQLTDALRCDLVEVEEAEEPPY